MKILGIVEGAFPRCGGIGLPGVPTLHASLSLASRGNRVVLLVAGLIAWTVLT